MEAHRRSVVTQEPEATSVDEVDEAGVADEDADTKVSRAIAEEAHRDAQVKGKCIETARKSRMCSAQSIEGERRSALACRRSTTRADGNDQCTSTDEDIC